MSKIVDRTIFRKKLKKGDMVFVEDYSYSLITSKEKGLYRDITFDDHDSLFKVVAVDCTLPADHFVELLGKCEYPKNRGNSGFPSIGFKRNDTIISNGKIHIYISSKLLIKPRYPHIPD